MHSRTHTAHESYPNSLTPSLFSFLDLVHGQTLSGRDALNVPVSKPAPRKKLLKRDCGHHVPPWDLVAFFSHLDTASRSLLIDRPSATQEKVKWSETRKRALARDGYRCRNPACRSGQPLTVHHIHPRGLFGSHHLSNLVTLCETCHQNLCATCSRPSHLRVPLGKAAMRFPDIAHQGQNVQVA
ncbi:MAG: HNH endonuclease [Methanoregulaceae archaeon PtaU1.Bin222]|nr:MAG: HNH endonuclease [Methanoregulaceae archaeon PtaU1.Bin222]